jgi:hypothetical protein
MGLPFVGSAEQDQRVGIEMQQILASVAVNRPIFHSEADFQHAFALAYMDASPSASIRLEYRIPLKNERAHADLWIRQDGNATYIELKYWTRYFDVVHDGEAFTLADQSALPLSRYDFIKDLGRIERVVHAGLANRGFVIALTNDPGYWNLPTQNPIDAAFRLSGGRVLTGDFAWEKHAGLGTIKKREQTMHLSGEYVCHWEPYSKLGGARGDFRYLMIEVPS